LRKTEGSFCLFGSGFAGLGKIHLIIDIDLPEE
jgi:hypothetical protein